MESAKYQSLSSKGTHDDATDKKGSKGTGMLGEPEKVQNNPINTKSDMESGFKKENSDSGITDGVKMGNFHKKDRAVKGGHCSKMLMWLSACFAISLLSLVVVFVVWTFVSYHDTLVSLQQRLNRLESDHEDYQLVIDRMVNERVDLLLSKRLHEFRSIEKRSAQKCDCRDGLPGLPGKKGELGPMGPKGENGFPGPIGSPGKAGDRGSSGTAGKQGEKGLSGEKGTKGDGGLPGFDGLPGSPGEKGPRGPPGLPAGLDAGKWEPQIIKLRGEPGERGLPGPKGDNGNPGLPGFDGVQGSVGPAGPEGPAGPRGPKGRDGTPGKPGTKGTRGKAGSGGYAGSEGNFPAGFIQGPPGKSGPRGKRGPPGPPGVATNADGTCQCSKGDKGDRGPAGKRGRRGKRGHRGLKGEPGSPGLDRPCPVDANGFPLPGCGVTFDRKSTTKRRGLGYH